MSRALLILSMTLALWPATMQAQIRVAVETSGELKAMLELKGDPLRGKAEFEHCSACHRKDASGRANGSTPRLSGQHASVILKQIDDIRGGRRINAPMKPFVDEPDLTAQAFADIASHLQGLPIVGARGKGPGTGLTRGQELFAKDCASCHGGKGEGRAERFAPMVAAQHYNYLLRELGLIRDGGRGNSDPEMVKVVKGYAADDLRAVADYMAQLPPPQR